MKQSPPALATKLETPLFCMFFFISDLLEKIVPAELATYLVIYENIAVYLSTLHNLLSSNTRGVGLLAGPRDPGAGVLREYTYPLVGTLHIPMYRHNTLRLLHATSREYSSLHLLEVNHS